MDNISAFRELLSVLLTPDKGVINQLTLMAQVAATRGGGGAAETVKLVEEHLRRVNKQTNE